MRDIPIINFWLLLAIVLFPFVAIGAGLSGGTIGWHFATGVGTIILLLTMLRSEAGMGAIKLLGVCALWLGPNEQLFFFLIIFGFGLWLFSLGLRVINKEVSTIPVLPFVFIAMLITLPGTDMGSSLQAAIAQV